MASSLWPMSWSPALSRPPCLAPRISCNTTERASDVIPRSSSTSFPSLAEDVCSTAPPIPAASRGDLPHAPDSVDAVVQFFRDSYPPVKDVRHLRSKVLRALAALSAVDDSRTALSLEADVLPKVELLDALSPGLALKVFSSYPEEFAHPYAAEYWRIMAALLYNSGFQPEAIGNLFSRHICLFARTVQDPANVRELFDWLHSELRLSQTQIVKLVDQFPLILQTNVSGILKSRFEYMSSLAGSVTAASTAVRRHPPLLGMDTAYIQVRVEFLENLGLSRFDIGKMLAYQPTIFSCRVEETLQPVIECLKQALQGDSDEQSEYQVEKNKVGKDDAALNALMRQLILGGVLTRSPAVLQRRICIWRELGMDTSTLRVALGRFRRLLVYPVDEPKYRLKLAFLQEEMGLTPSDLVAFPQYISYSLGRRIAPRVAAAKALHGTVPHLSALALKDETFCKVLGISMEAFQDFVAEWVRSKEAQRWLAGDGNQVS